MDVCVVGHVTRDRIRAPGRALRELPGGTALYAAFAYARLGLRTELVTRLRAADAPSALAGLREEGVAIRWHDAPETTTFDNEYERADQDTRVQRVRSIAPALTDADVGDARPSYFHVGPLTERDVSVSLLRSMHERGARVALDVQGMLRRVDADRVRLVDWAEKAAGLACVTILKADGAEAEILTGARDPMAAAAALAALGPREVLVTLASRGSVVLADGRATQIPAFVPRTIADATGCGDTYLAAYVTFRARGEEPAAAARLAAAAATLKLEHAGPLRSGAAEVRRTAAPCELGRRAERSETFGAAE